MAVKKFILSAFVIVMFLGYSFASKHSDGQVPIKPNSGSGNNSSTSNGSSVQLSSTGQSSQSQTTYKDGTYTGSTADAFYGNIQVQVTVSGGKIADVRFLQYPNDRQNSIYINQQAMPLLRQEAIQVQTAHIDGVSGATATSQAFVESLSSALSKAS